ncbi:hypothetical protein CEXT_179901 [Caerostris extrusa]|uniref:Uncharacterized protein n=1 Tax=Caerostris extrusa TaxID=172846 RepID=A0AAV4YDU0_CAEEX|nr:hypothetical protein CEXT_179901 [Caerostris extrusa]
MDNCIISVGPVYSGNDLRAISLSLLAKNWKPVFWFEAGMEYVRQGCARLRRWLPALPVVVQVKGNGPTFDVTAGLFSFLYPL